MAGLKFAMDEDGRGSTDPPASLVPTSAHKLSDEENPFLRQLHLMLDKPSSGRASEAGAARDSSTPSAAVVDSFAEDELDEWNIWPSVAQPKTASDRVGRVTPLPPPQQQPSNQESWQLPPPLIDIDDLESSSDGDDKGGAFRMANSLPPSSSPSQSVPSRELTPSMAMAEVKSDEDRGWSGQKSSRSEEDGRGEESPGPDSDGKRCPPANLNVAREKVGDAEGDRGGCVSHGGRRGMKSAPQTSSSRGVWTTSQGRVDIIGCRAYPGGRITESGKTDDRCCSLQRSGVRDGSLGSGRVGGGISEGDDWMSDAEETGALPVTHPVSCVGKPKARDGCKKEFTSCVRSPETRGTGGRTSRSERYTTPVPRRPRSSSLSLTPPLRSTAFDSDEDSAGEKLPAGGKETSKGSRSSKMRKLSLTSRDQRGRKGGREELLGMKDRIEAMQVDNDGEWSTGGGASGLGGKRGGVM